MFNRLISLALVHSSLECEIDLRAILSYELAPFPPALFESDIIMLKANKPQITELLKNFYTPIPTDNAPALRGINVIDRSS